MRQLFTFPFLERWIVILTSRFIVGQYKPSDSFGHKLDPRAKIIFTVFLMIMALFTTSPTFYLTIIFGTLLLLLFSGIKPGILVCNLKPFLILILFTALYHLLFSARETATLITVFSFNITEGGVSMAIGFSLRLIVFVGLAFFISLTTLPSDIAETLVNCLKPMKKIGVPVNDIGLIVFIAMRFIPVLAGEFETIRKAQIVRGVDFSGGLIARARKLVFLLVPVFQSAIRRADDLAIAIESRGYISGAERSSFREFKFNSADYFFIIISISVVALVFWITKN